MLQHMNRINNSILINSIKKKSKNFSVKAYNSPESPIPMIEHYRPRWPEKEFLPETKSEFIPQSTVNRDDIKFTMSATFSKGKSYCYPHLSYHPSDYKVILNVSIDKLGLTDEEKTIFCALVGPRFRAGQREVRLVCNQFSNRMENKIYATYLLEKLILESKRIYSISNEILSLDTDKSISN